MRLQVPIGEPKGAMLVHEEAAGDRPGQRFVYIVNNENKVEYRRVKVGWLDGNRARVIEEGLQSGDRVVLTNLQRIRPQDEVAPKLAEPAENVAAAAAEPESPARPTNDGGSVADDLSVARLWNNTSQGTDRGGIGFHYAFTERRCRVLAVLHRSPDLRRGAVDRRSRWPAAVAVVHAADRAVPADHAADGAGRLQLSGATPRSSRETVAAPIEQQVNGVEDMLYMSSQCTNDGIVHADGHVQAGRRL